MPSKTKKNPYKVEYFGKEPSTKIRNEMQVFKRGLHRYGEGIYSKNKWFVFENDILRAGNDKKEEAERYMQPGRTLAHIFK